MKNTIEKVTLEGWIFIRWQLQNGKSIGVKMVDLIGKTASNQRKDIPRERV